MNKYKLEAFYSDLYTSGRGSIRDTSSGLRPLQIVDFTSQLQTSFSASRSLSTVSLGIKGFNPEDFSSKTTHLGKATIYFLYICKNV